MPLKTILVHPQDIIPDADYMHDAKGRMDLLGQILLNGFGITVPPKTRVPSELKRAIYPFVKQYRKYCYCDTDITLCLLDIAGLSGSKQVEIANRHLSKFNIQLVTEKMLEQARENLE